MPTSLDPAAVRRLTAALATANASFAGIYPGEPIVRQAVHTVYGGAHLFRHDSARRLGDVALAMLREFAPDFASFARAIRLNGHQTLPATGAETAAAAESIRQDPAQARRLHPAAWLAHEVYRRVTEKLAAEPVEDFRIDFEDGYGTRPDAEEDACAEQAAAEVALGMERGTLPPFIGLRIKNFGSGTAERGIRTLDLFLTTLARRTRGELPPNFVVMLPKLVSAAQVEAMVGLFEQFEAAGTVRPGSLKMEFMVETTQSVIAADGRCPLPEFVRAAKGRCTAAALGVYDYTASVGVTAQEQRIDHRACDFARHAMQVALGGTGLNLSDGATNIMPTPPHRPADGAALSDRELAENRAAVHEGWRLHFEHVRRSLAHGYYQGWDLNPGQLPTRYAAVYSYFLEYLGDATARLRNFVDKAARATLAGGGVFDDAATAQGLLTFFIQGVRRKALSPDDIAATGLSIDEIRGRSFAAIVQARQARA